MTTQAVGALALLLAGTAPAFAQTAASDAGLAERMDAAIDAALEENRIVGTVVLVARGGEVVYARAAGMADREAGVPVTEDTIFRLASVVTKPIVPTAVMQLVGDGRIDLDDPVTDWLPDFRPTFEGEAPVITIEQLLTHTSGLGCATPENGDGPYTRAGVIDGMAESEGQRVTLDENLRRIASAPLLFEPGTSWTHSIAIDVLGAVVEAETGSPLPEAVEDLVTGPLGMDDTMFTVEEPARLAAAYADGDPLPVRMEGLASVPYYNRQITYEPARNLDPTAFPSGGSGMAGTAEDVMLLLEAIRTEGQPILDEAITAQMMADHVGPQAAANGPGWGFGFGGAVLVDPAATGSPQAVGTYSWSGAYGSFWFVDPAHDLTVVALTNTAIEGMSGQFATDVRDAAYPE